MALDVLDLDDCIVHEHADHEREREQRDGVERVAKVMKPDKGRNHRQGQRRRRNQRGAPVAQEPPDHEHREQRALVKQFHRAAEILGHRRGVVDDLRQRNVGVLSLQLRHSRAHAVRNLDFAGAFRAKDLEADHDAPVLHRDRARLGHGVEHGGNLVEANMAPVFERNVKPRELGGGLDRCNRAHRLLGAADIAAAAGRFLLHQLEAARDIECGDLQRGHLVGVELDAHLAINSTHALDSAHAGHAKQALGHGVVDKPAQRLIIQRID